MKRIFAIIFVMVLFLSGCVHTPDPTGTVPTLVKPEIAPPKLVQVTRGEFRDYYAYHATVAPYSQGLFFDISGVIGNAYVYAGKAVKKGELLAELDHSALSARIVSLETDIADTETVAGYTDRMAKLQIDILKVELLQLEDQLAVAEETAVSRIRQQIALKKNEITVYPLWVRQYTDGAFADRYAYIFRDGGWVRFSEIVTELYIIKDGAVDQEKYPYQYTYQYWNSSTSSNSTRTGGVDSSRIKFEQEHEGKLAVWTEATNGAWQRNEFSNIVVPNGASVFYFQYYQLPVYRTAQIKVGEASVSVAKQGANYRYNETVSIDVSALRGQTVTFSYETGGASGAQSCYVGNAWFE